MRTFVYIYVILLSAPALTQAALYRWVDSRGEVHYSDQVPPAEAEHERKILDKSGRTIDTIERSKTLDELKELKRLQKLRAKEREQQELRESMDRTLLLTYQSAEEIAAARDTRVAAIENAIQNVVSSQQTQKARLDEARHSAAEYERTSRPIPQSVLDQMQSIKIQIEQYDQYIAKRRQEQERVRQEFAGYIIRYKELTR